MLAAALLLLAAPVAADWRRCDEGLLNVTGGAASPATVRAGTEIAFSINGTLPSAVESGRLTCGVDYLGIPVLRTEGDLCAAAPCPLPPGDTSLVLRQRLPRAAPPGPYLGSFQVRRWSAEYAGPEAAGATLCWQHPLPR